ncbi:MAG: hypothetical protein ACRERU_13635 [Methylococcales bacterium]
MKTKTMLAITNAAILTSALVTSASAHEVRLVGSNVIADGNGYLVILGWGKEPLDEDETAGVDVFVQHNDCDPLDPNCFPTPVDNSAGDTVDLNVKILKLKHELPFAQARLTSNLSSSLFITTHSDTLELNDPSNGHYVVPHITPTKDGAYGFKVTGNINGTPLNLEYYCGAGANPPPDNLGELEGFACVGQPIPFPGNISDRYKDN